MAPSKTVVVAVVVAIVAVVYAMKLKKKVDEYGAAGSKMQFGDDCVLNFFWTDRTGRIRPGRSCDSALTIMDTDDQGASLLFTNHPEIQDLIGRKHKITLV